MKLFPAIDLYDGCAVRLLRGDYAQMTVYSRDPAAVARSFAAEGARYLHLVDLAGARDGGTPNADVVAEIISSAGLITEIGGGVRSADVIERYLSLGAARVILGTAAVSDPALLESAAREYGARLAVGVDLRDGQVAVKGWTETAGLDGLAFCDRLAELGVGCAIVTDISRDGAMQGTNRALYRTLAARYAGRGLKIVASGGVSTLDDVRALTALGVEGAILGRALYTGDLSLRDALRAAEEEATV